MTLIHSLRAAPGSVRQPPAWLSWSVSLLLIALVAYARLSLLHYRLLPLAYGVPLLAALWHRSRTQLYFSAVAFSILSYLKVFVFLPDAAPQEPWFQWSSIAMMMADIWVIVAVVHIVARSWERLYLSREEVLSANQELEATNHELAQREEEITRQNEELHAQSEELERQSEELRQQAEELEQQTSELQSANDELMRRERGLQTLLESARWLRSDLSVRDVMSAVCQAAVQVMEQGVVAAAVMREQSRELAMIGQFGFGVQGAIRQNIAFDRSFAQIVMERAQTAFIEDLAAREDIEIPQPIVGRPLKSVLASPLYIEGRVVGVVEVYSYQPRKWSESEFRVIEWLAAQCALALQAIDYQQEVIMKRREAEDASRQKTRFLAAVSHDVRTPANAISLMADLIEDAATRPGSTTELPALTRDLKANARTLVELVSDVLDLTRLDTGTPELQISDFLLEPFLRNELRQFEPLAREKKVAINLDIHQPDLHLRTDRMKLARIMANLIGNAVKFTESGQIEIVTRAEPNGDLAIAVSDSGIGIPQEVLHRIFDEFFQIRNPERDRNKGSGLGLAICRRLVDALSCSLAVESAVGVGSTFTLRVPAALVALGPAAPINESPVARFSGEPQPLTGIRILLVEDHDVTRRAAARLLASKGASVLHAATGREAIHILAHDAPDVLLLDLMLPDMDGTEILRRVTAQRPPNLQCVLAVSGDVRDARVDEVRQLGADDLVAKPLNIQRLMDAILARTQQPKQDTPPNPRDGASTWPRSSHVEPTKPLRVDAPQEK